MPSGTAVFPAMPLSGCTVPSPLLVMTLVCPASVLTHSSSTFLLLIPYPALPHTVLSCPAGPHRLPPWFCPVIYLVFVCRVLPSLKLLPILFIHFCHSPYALLSTLPCPSVHFTSMYVLPYPNTLRYSIYCLTPPCYYRGLPPYRRSGTFFSASY